MPLRLFRIRTVCCRPWSCSSSASCMFGAVTYLPTFLQIANGASASNAGLLLVPLMFGILGSSILAGQIISHTGRYRIFPIAGMAVATLGMYLLSTLGVHSTRFESGVYMFVARRRHRHGDADPRARGPERSADRRPRRGHVDGRFLPGGRRIGRGGGIRGAVHQPSHRAARREGGSATSLRRSSRGLARNARETTALAFADAITRVFEFAVPLLLLGFVLACFIKETPLRTSSGDVRQRWPSSKSTSRRIRSSASRIRRSRSRASTLKHRARRRSATNWHSYAVICIVCGMAYRAAVVGGSGYTGAELLRLLAGHPEIEVVLVTADSNVGASVSELFPSLAAAYPSLVYAPLHGRRPRRARRGLPRAAARPVAGDRGIARRHRRPPRRPRRRLPAAARRLRAVVRRDAHRAGAARPVRVRPARAVPRRHRRGPARRRPRLLSDDRVARARRRCCATGSWSRRASWSTPRRACRARGAAPRSRACSPRSTRTSPPTACSRIATPPRWRWRSRTSPAQPVQVLFTPHLVPDDEGHPRHLLRAARRRHAQHRRAARPLPRVLRRRAVRGRHRRVARAPRPRSARTPRTSPCATTSARTRCSRSARSTTS